MPSHRCPRPVVSLSVLLLALAVPIGLWGQGKDKADGPVMAGGGPSRNLANTVEKGIPGDFSAKKGKEKGLKWKAVLGDTSYSAPVIAGGRVFVATNNKRPRDPALKGDKGVLMCFKESDGSFLWQAVHDKFKDGDQDFGGQGIASTPAVEGERLWYVSNRAELVCADVKGDGKGKAKFHWTIDMRKELGVHTAWLAANNPLLIGDLVYVNTGNGTDVSAGGVPSPKAPSFLAVNKNTGKVVWQARPDGEVLRGQWSSPAAVTIKGKTQVLFGGGDGYLYSLDARTGEKNWKFYLNPKKATPYKVGGGGEQGFAVATPVVWENKAYIAIGQEPDDGPGAGHLWCIDLTKTPKGKDRDLSPKDDNFDPRAAVNKGSALVWHYGGPKVAKGNDPREYKIGRTLSSVAIHDGVLYILEGIGYLYCFDARTGELLYDYDFNEGTQYPSPYYVDGKVFVPAQSGVYVFQHGRKLQAPRKIDLGGSNVPPVAANGTLYINTGSNLYAFSAKP